MISSRPKTDSRRAGILEAADFLQAEVDRQKAQWIENGVNINYMTLNPSSFAHTRVQTCVNMLMGLVNEPCKHEWVKVASSMAESQYKCAKCSEEDWH